MTEETPFSLANRSVGLRSCKNYQKAKQGVSGREARQRWTAANLDLPPSSGLLRPNSMLPSRLKLEMGGPFPGGGSQCHDRAGGGAYDLFGHAPEQKM